MFDYLKKSYRKLIDDVLAKAIYDIGKYAVIALITYGLLNLLPSGSSVGDFLQRIISLTVLQLGLLLFVAVTTTIIIYFLINRKRFAIIKQDLHTDELTGIPNNRALKQDLNKTIEWAKSENKPFSIILMDIDNFKDLNTKFNQKTADAVLVKFGTLLKADNRLTDTVYRQHVKGDEFVIITKETILENAVKAADRKRTTISKTGIQVSGYATAFSVTVCCGVVEFNPKLDNDETILERAFTAMKDAKTKTGKNSTISLI